MNIKPFLPVASADTYPDRMRTGAITGSGMLLTFAVVAVLHYGRPIFLPLAIALLITFALSPIVSMLRKAGISLLLSVLAAVSLAFAGIGAFLTLLASQVGSLAAVLPTYQGNILAKLEDLQRGDGGQGIISRLIRMVETIGNRIGTGSDATGAAAGTDGVLSVEVVESQSLTEVLRDVVLPLVTPLATAGLVMVVVIFMLLEREELRDRFIRLIGATELHRTTEVLEDAGSRVGSYLLIQLLVNIIYAVPIGVGLWLIGVPNALLWGLLTLVLRFVPYIGSWLAAIMPMMMAFASSPDWAPILWTLALFAVVEFVTSNAIEPYLYGSKTGVSPLAIIIAAIFWTWVWGPLGLVLSTPLTVCLVVLGRHIPQFKLFEILFGDQPVLSAHSRLYQRLLSGDAVESFARAEEALDTEYLADYYRDVGIPALLLAQADYDRGVLTDEQELRVAETAARVVDNLQHVVEAEREEAAQDGEAPVGPASTYRVLTIGGRTRLDDISAAMLAQTLSAEGAPVENLQHSELMPANVTSFRTIGTGCVILCFLDPAVSRASLLHIRRIKRANPELRVGVVIWAMPETLGGGMWRKPEAKMREAEELGADFVVSDIDAAMRAAFLDEKPRTISDALPKHTRPGIARRPAREAATIPVV
jgi:predicted PurR-regulated permease PerM